jgi:NADH-quinone oxidoreductase subunit N
MNSSFVWIVLPFVVGLVLLLFRRQRNLVLLVAASVCFFLVLLAWLLPIGSVIRMGPISILISPEWVIIGRRFVLDAADRSFLILMYLFGGVGFLGTRQADAPNYFPAVGLTMLALLIAAQAVEPFLYAALILEMAVLISLPLLSPPGKPTGSGALRYLIFQTMAIPFILLAGWAAGMVDANPPGTPWVLQAVLFLGLGFALWLAVFPLYTWVPLIAQQVPPYIFGFLLGLLPVGVLWIALGFLDSFPWLRANSLVVDGLRLSGGLMVLTAGVWAAFQSDMARSFGYAILLENGYALLAISLRSSLGMDLFAAAIIPRLVAIAVWSLSMSVLQKNGIATTLQGLTGILRRYPIAGVALAMAYFSLGGLPLLASFPVRQPLVETLAGQSLPVTFAVIIGNMGFLLGAYRLLTTLVRSDEKDWKISETRVTGGMLLFAMLLLVLAGMLPGVFLRGSTALVQGFTHLR